MDRITKRIDPDTVELFPDTNLPARINRFDDDMHFRMNESMFAILDKLCDYEDAEELTHTKGVRLSDDDKRQVYLEISAELLLSDARRHVEQYFNDIDDIVPESIDYDEIASLFTEENMDNVPRQKTWHSVIEQYLQTM